MSFIRSVRPSQTMFEETFNLVAKSCISFFKYPSPTIIIMLDTSMYSNEDKSLKKVEHCYQRLFELHGLDNPNGDTIKNVCELQKKRVEAFVDTLDEGRLKNIIVIYAI